MQARMPGLDALRAAAVLVVMAGHAAWPLGVPDDAWAVPSQAAVNAFFALSGFLVGGIALREIRGPADIPHFLCRRWLRTIPAAVVVAVLAAAIFREPLRELLLSASLIRFLATDSTRVFMMNYWSLAVEELAYLLLPLLVLALRGRDPLPRLAAIWAALAVGREALVWAAELPAVTANHAAPLRLDAILAGVVVAAAQPRLNARLRAALFWLGIGGLMALPMHSTVQPALFALTLPALAAWRPRDGMAWACIRHVAALSYGLYLIHFPTYGMAATMRGALPPWVLLSAAVALSWLLALALRRYVELPFLALRDRRPPRSRAVLAAD